MKLFIEKSDVTVCLCKLNKQSYVSKHYHTRENKSSLLLILGVNFYHKLKYENNAIHKSKNVVDWVFFSN